MAQITKTLTKHPPGSLTSNTEVNPRESLKTVTLRSERELKPTLTQGSETTSPEPEVVIVKDTSIGGNV